MSRGHVFGLEDAVYGDTPQRLTSIVCNSEKAVLLEISAQVSLLLIRLEFIVAILRIRLNHRREGTSSDAATTN